MNHDKYQSPEGAIADALAKLRKDYRLKGSGLYSWVALCPAHDDRNRSLQLWHDDDGKLRFKCWAGCSFRDVRRALGMTVPSGNAARRPIDEPRDRPPPRYNFTHLAAMFQMGVGALVPLADQLGVPAWTLAALRAGRMLGYPMFVNGTGRDRNVTAWTFPMWDAAGGVCGLRLRFADGTKAAFTDSRAGLFKSSLQRPDGPLVIVEGPTDAAAVLAWEFNVIGRPSCNDGGALIDAELAAGPKRDVVILSNQDGVKTRGDGSTFRPGQDGAEALAAAIAWRCKSLRIILPPPGIKDARAWRAAGGTRPDVLAMIGAKRGWKPQPQRKSA